MASNYKSLLIPAVLFALLINLFGACNETNSTKEKVAEVVVEKKEPVIDSLLITDSSWGFIRADMNFSDLKVLYGEANLKDERICGPECIDSLDVTKLYPGTNNETIIYWKEKAWHKTIAMIMCYQDSALYHTDKGLKMKSGLSELLRLNGQKISFSGFGWDYGGTITSYNNGLLDKTALHYELDLSKDPAEEEMGVFGDTALDTDMPLIKKIMPYIYIRKFTLVLNNHEY
jgi:hypothetical protein